MFFKDFSKISSDKNEDDGGVNSDHQNSKNQNSESVGAGQIDGGR